MSRKAKKKTVLVPAREANGRTVREPDKITGVAASQPHRRGTVRPLDPRHGYAVGRLRLMVISRKTDDQGRVHDITALDEDQHDALVWVTKITVRYMAKVTGSLPRFPSVMADRVGGGGGDGGGYLDADDVFGIRLSMEEVDAALMDHPQQFSFVQAKSLIMKVCILDEAPASERDRGMLREIANVLHRLRTSPKRRARV